MRFLLFCVCLLWPVATFAQTSAEDRGYIQALLEDSLSGDGRIVHIEGFAGLLSSRATIEKITIADDTGIWLEMANVAMIWERTALLSGAVNIDEISVGHFDLKRMPVTPASAPAPEAKSSFALPELPVSLSLQNLSVARADLGAGILGETLQLTINGSANLSEGTGQATLNLIRQDKGGALTFSGGYSNADRILALDLDLSEPEGGFLSTKLGLFGAPDVDLTLLGKAPIDAFRAEMALKTKGQDRLAGALTLQFEEDTDNQIADLDISGDISPLTPPEYHAFLGDAVALKLSAKRDAQGALHLENLNLMSQALALSGKAEIASDGWPRNMNLRGTITPPDGPPVLLPLRGEEIYIDQADLTLEFDAARNDGWQLRGQIKHPKRGAFSAATLSLSGQGKISRDTQQVQGDITLAALGLDLGSAPLNQSFGPALKGKLHFDWRQNQPLILSDLDMSGIGYGLTGHIAVSGVTELAPKVETDLFLETLNLTQFSALSGVDLAGAANLKITGEVEPLLGAFDLTFVGATRDLETGVTQLDPVLQGDGHLNLRVTRDTRGTRIMSLEITTSAATVAGTADLKTGGSAIKASVELTDAALVHPELTGPTTVLLTANQSERLWQIDLSSRLPADTALSFNGTLEDMTDLHGTLTAQVGRLAALNGITQQDLSGRAEVSLIISGDLATQKATLDGNATLNAFRIGNPTLDPLMAGTIQVAVKGNLDADQRINLETLALTGTHVLGSASGHLASDSSALDFMLRLPNLGIISSEISGAGSVQGTAAHSGGDWRIDVTGDGPGGSTLSVSGTATPSFDRLTIAARGTAPLALANRRLAPQTLTGMLDYDLSLNGTPSLAALSGSAVTRNARLSVPAARLILDQLSARITLGGGQANLNIDTALPDGGSLRITGPISLAAPYQASLAAQLRNATLREPSLFETTANGDLTLTGALTGGARIGGQIDLGRVELRIPQLGPSYSSLSGLKHIDPPADVARTLRFAGLSQTPGTAPAPSTAFPLDLRITAQNRIFVRGRGLDAELGGDLRLTGTTRDIVPVGQFDLIRGRLDLLRRRLELTEGSISLRGSFDPQLIFAATTQVDDTDITIGISGPASEPALKVSSSPELPQDQVLALFLFGRDVTSLSALQAVQLASAIRTLTGQGGLGLTQQIRGGLGLDDLDIGTADDGTTQARVGKYISDNIYTDATVKSTGEAQINLNLDLSDTVTVRGRVGSDGDTGIGIFFERDY